ncbi:MAG: metal-dependent hydrolase [Saprospiraceae bacterium]
MDTLTQLTLGAACGEAVLGKKVGNRAMLWGAFGGLLPDFDVFAMFFTDEMTALAFHRGFMHSILFAVLAALGLGWLVERLYSSGFYRRRRYKWAVAGFIIAFYLLLLGGFYFIFRQAILNVGFLAAAALAGAGLVWFLWSKYINEELDEVQATRRGWMWLFFISIVTHPILDCFTVFGTQLFQPFSDYRVSFDNISVADPIYTVPLLLGILAAAFIRRDKKARQLANWAGLVLSSAYMALSFYHKAQFNKVFEQSLGDRGIRYERFMSGPTILNNYLWSGVAEGDTAYYQGFYSLLDKEQKIHQIYTLPKNHNLVVGHQDDRSMRILRWFSKGYYNIITRQDGQLQLNDLRYGSFEEGFKTENDYIFKFILEEKDGQMEAKQSREGREINGEAFSKFFKRVLAEQVAESR